MHNIHHLFKKIIINHFLFTNHPLPQLLSLSRMHAWKLFRKHQMFSNWICFSSRRRSGPRRTRSAASEEVVTSLSDSGENPTTPVRHWHHSADISENWWNSVRTSFESWGTISGSIKWHHSVRKWNLLKMVNVHHATSSPTSDIFLVTINLSVTQDYRPGKSHLLDLFASHVFLSAVCDSHFQFLSTFFTFNLIPPQLVSWCAWNKTAFV